MGIMRFEELAENVNLHIDVFSKVGHLQYDAVTKYCMKGAVLIEPIRYEKQIINFVRSDIIIKVFYARNNRKPIEWRDCQIKVVEYKGNYYHMITCKNVGVEVNRRECFRMFVGEDGQAQVGEHNGIMKVNVKDISATGFSFFAKRESQTPVGEHVRLTFDDIVRKVHFDLNGKLVRKEIGVEDRVLYACELFGTNQTLDSYIAQRQREQAQHFQKQLIQRTKENYEKLN